MKYGGIYDTARVIRGRKNISFWGYVDDVGFIKNF